MILIWTTGDRKTQALGLARRTERLSGRPSWVVMLRPFPTQPDRCANKVRRRDANDLHTLTTDEEEPSSHGRVAV